MLTFRWRRAVTGLAIPALALAGCQEFLTDDYRLDQNPNNPSEASIDNLYNAMQVIATDVLTGQHARTTSILMQQMMGTERQYLSQSTYDIDWTTFSFIPYYSLGGLVNLRRIQDRAVQSGDRLYLGIAKVWEAYLIGTAADLWGDVPYRAALNADTAQVADDQLQVYADLQGKLDEAVAEMACTSASCVGPRGLDRIYDGSAAKWIQVANTLKARFYLHTAEVDPTAYAKALAAARNGIASPANDFRSYQSSTPRETNLWYQFIVEQRVGYISAGQFLVDLLKSRSDPRLAAYFSPNDDGEFAGARASTGSPENISNLSAERLAPSFRQPLITWAENQLIIAEAAFRTGDEGRARTALNAVRTAVELPAVNLSGQALFEAIMTEKYISLFQNIEVWNDYRRTCLPRLTPATTAGIPRRILYPLEERNVNPNIPTPAEQPVANPNDPNGCQ